jgi:hypothetical protein
MSDQHALTRAEYESEIDVTIADSFPASDPPSWTFGAPPWKAPAAAPPVPSAIDAGEPPPRRERDR